MKPRKGGTEEVNEIFERFFTKQQKKRWVKRYTWNAKETAKYKENLLATTDREPLSKKTIRDIEDYALERFKDIRYASWLELFALYRGEFKEGWLPPLYFENEWEFINTSYRSVSAAKTLNAKHIGSELLPDAYYHINGRWYNLRYKGVSKGDVVRCLKRSGEEYVILKIDGGNRGRGCEVVSVDEVTKIQCDCSVQKIVTANSVFHALCPDALPTIRIITATGYGGRPRHVGSYLRVGRLKERWVQSATALKIPVLDQCGRLKGEALDDKWRGYAEHPDTGARFSEIKIPRYLECVEKCVSAHDSVPFFSIVGWDLAVDNDERIWVLELNAGKPAVTFAEAAVGPMFSDVKFERR